MAGKSVEDQMKKNIADTIAVNTKVPIKQNHIKSFENVSDGVYKVTLDEKYKIVDKLKKAMDINLLVFTGAELSYLGDEILMDEGQEDYVTKPLYGFSTTMYSIKDKSLVNGERKLIPSAFVCYVNKKEADKTDKMVALSHDEKKYNRRRNA